MRFPKSNNPIRVRWIRIYAGAGIACLGFWSSKGLSFSRILIILKAYSGEIFWCLSWGAFGVAAGLYNSRTDRKGNASDPQHYRYFIFVWLIATLAAFVILGVNSVNGNVIAYASAALVGFIVGFAGDNLAGKILSLK